jgi:hypothetical protein
MKKAFLACLICLAGTLAAQDKLLPAQIIDPADPLGVSKFFQNRKSTPGMVAPQALTLMGVMPRQAGVCSVPLLTANANTGANDRIASRPPDVAVPIPQARVPAPACGKD